MDGDPSLDQTGAVVGQVLDDDISSTVAQETIQGRRLLVLGDGVSDFDDAPTAPT
jgi:hypothetical protein